MQCSAVVISSAVESNHIAGTELKVGIFAKRAMVDQDRQSLCYQKLNILVYLT